jgi:hypothetical protein
LSAAARHRFDQLGSYTLVRFFGRNCAARHGLGGTHRTDVLPVAGPHQRGVRVVSLDEPRLVRTPQRTAFLPLSEVLPTAGRSCPRKHVAETSTPPRPRRGRKLAAKPGACLPTWPRHVGLASKSAWHASYASPRPDPRSSSKSWPSAWPPRITGRQRGASIRRR